MEFDYMFFFGILFGHVYEVIYKAVILIVANIDFYIYIWFTQEEMFQSLSWTPIFARNLLPSLNQKTYIFSTGASECRERPFQSCSVASGLQATTFSTATRH